MKILFSTIIGRPNVGKSTLLNNILEYDLAIVSSKPQATRDQIMGIYSDDDYQLIFTDTPGIYKTKTKFGENLNAQSYESLKDIDLVIFLSPANEEIGPGDEFICEKIKNFTNKIALITKIDLENSEEVLKKKAEKLKSLGFKEIFAISSKDHGSIKKLINEIKKYSYEGERQFDEDMITEKSEKFIAKESIREACIDLLEQELPHSILVEIDSFSEEEREEKNLVEIHSTIYVNKESQKGILIGKGGSKIKKIGISARKKIQRKLGVNVKLFLKIKVKKNWVNQEKIFKKFDN